MTVSLPGPVADRMARMSARWDMLLPGRVTMLYVVGSAALGSYRPGRSDIDFVAVLSGVPSAPEFAALRRYCRQDFAAELARFAASRGRLHPAGVNGVFVLADDLHRPVSEVHPVASQIAGRFRIGAGNDVNPVTWKILAERGLPVRGPDPRMLGIPLDAAELTRWTRRNLGTYWVRWAASARSRSVVSLRAATPWGVAWSTLGVPRLHATLTTGRIVTKEQAGAYALEHFDARWHPLIRTGLAYRNGQRPFRGPRRSYALAVAAFTEMVIAAAPHEGRGVSRRCDAGAG